MESSSEPAQFLYECDDLACRLVQKPTLCRKCSPKEDMKICFGDLKSDSETTNSVKDKTTSIHSQDAIFQSIKLESEESNPAIDKCLKFWKTILDTSLKPTRFHFKEDEKKAYKSKAGKSKPEPKADSFNWRSLYEEIKRKQLDKVRLYKKVDCKTIELEDLDCGLKVIKPYKRFMGSDARKLKSKLVSGGTKSSKSLIELNKLRQQAARERREIQENELKLMSSTVAVKKRAETNNYVNFEEEKLARAMRERERLRRDIASKSQRSLAQRLLAAAAETEPESAAATQPLCCACGCALDYCLCERVSVQDDTETAELLDDLRRESLQLVRELSLGQLPLCQCGCLMHCSCERLTDLEAFTCPCSCKMHECICDIYRPDEQLSRSVEESIDDERDFWNMGAEKVRSYCIICGEYCSCTAKDIIP